MKYHSEIQIIKEHYDEKGQRGQWLSEARTQENHKLNINSPTTDTDSLAPTM